MEKIIFRNVIPHVFAQRTDLKSDIWNTEVVFEKGRLYLVEAASGMGKSTFCSYVVGYRHDYSGEVLFDSDDTKSYGVTQWTEMRKSHISHLFQELRLFPELTAWENVEIKCKLTGYSDTKRIESWFERLGIPDKMNALIGEMSFGQQQRVALMRSLVQPFDFLLLDEPISHLDDNNGRIMGEIVLEEAKARNAGVIMTSIGKHIDLDYNKTFRL
mgnify:CR=1 FL=1